MAETDSWDCPDRGRRSADEERRLGGLEKARRSSVWVPTEPIWRADRSGGVGAMERKQSPPACRCQRRDLLEAALGLTVGWAAWPAAAEDEPQGPAAMPPQPGDRFVFLTGDK